MKTSNTVIQEQKLLILRLRELLGLYVSTDETHEGGKWEEINKEFLLLKRNSEKLIKEVDDYYSDNAKETSPA